MKLTLGISPCPNDTFIFDAFVNNKLNKGDFEIEGTAIFSRVRCLTKPTDTVRPPQRRAAQWRLISGACTPGWQTTDLLFR